MFHFLSSVYNTVVTEEEPQRILFLGIEDSGKTTLFEQCKYLLSDDRRSLPMPRYVPRGPLPIEALSSLSSSSSYAGIATSTVSATPHNQDAVSPASTTLATNATNAAYFNSNNSRSPAANLSSSSSVGGGSLTPTCSMSSTPSPSQANMAKGSSVGLSASPIRNKYIRTTIGLNVAKVRLSSKLRHVSPPPLAEQLTPIYCSDVNVAALTRGHGSSAAHVGASGGTTATPPPLMPLTAVDTTIVDQPITLWDMGGKSDLRELWLSYLKQCDGIVFVIGLPVAELVQTQQIRRGIGKTMSGLICGSPRSCPCAVSPSSSISSSVSPSYACCRTCPCYKNRASEAVKGASTPSFSSPAGSSPRPFSPPPSSSFHSPITTLSDLVADSASVKKSKAVLHSLLVHPALLKVPILVVGNVMQDGGPVPLPARYSVGGGGGTVAHSSTSPSCAETPTPTSPIIIASGEVNNIVHTGGGLLAPTARAAAATPASEPSHTPAVHATLTSSTVRACVETEVRKRSLDEGTEGTAAASTTAKTADTENGPEEEDPSSKISRERGSSTTTTSRRPSAHSRQKAPRLPKSHSLVSVSSATDTDTDEDLCTIRGEKEGERDDGAKNATHGEESTMAITGRTNGSYGSKEARRTARELPKGRKGPRDVRGEGKDEDEREDGEEGNESETKLPSPSPFSSAHQSFEDSTSGKFVFLVGTGAGDSFSATTDIATHSAVIINSNGGSVSGCGGGGGSGASVAAAPRGRSTASINIYPATAAPNTATSYCSSNSISTSTAAYASVSASVGGHKNDQHDDEASSVSSCCPSSHLHRDGRMPKEGKAKSILVSAIGSPIITDMPVEDTAAVVSYDNETDAAAAAPAVATLLTTPRDLPPRHPKTPPPPPANSLPPLGRGGGGSGGLVSPPQRSACASSASPTGDELIRSPNSSSSFVVRREDGICYSCTRTGGGGGGGGAPPVAIYSTGSTAKGKEDSGHTNHQPPHRALLLEAFEESLGLPSVIAGAINELEATIAGGGGGGGGTSKSKGGEKERSSSVASDAVVVTAAESNSDSYRRSVSAPRREGSVSSVFGSVLQSSSSSSAVDATTLHDGVVSGAPFGNGRATHRVLFDVATRRYKVVLLDAMEGNGVVDALCWLSSTIRSVKVDQDHAAAAGAGGR